MTGKKLGIIAFVCAIIFAICLVIVYIYTPDIPQEIIELSATDIELYWEKYYELYDNVPAIYHIADNGSAIIGLAGVILAIISLVKMNKANEKGKIFPILALVIIIGSFLVCFMAMFAKGIEMGMQVAQ